MLGEPEIPIFVAAIGPKNVELTAEIADGWMPVFFLPEMAPKVWGAALAAGGARRWRFPAAAKPLQA